MSESRADIQIDDLPVARPVAAVPSHPMWLENISPGRAWLDLLSFIVMLLVVTELIGLLAGVFFDPQDPEQARIVQFVATLVRGLIIMAATIALLKIQRVPVASVGLCSDRIGLMCLLGGAGVVATFAVHFAVLGILYLIDPIFITVLQQNPENIIEMIPRWHPALLLGSCLFVGIYEEVIFRGYVLTRLVRGTCSRIIAVIGASAFFAMVHWGQQEWVIVIPLFVVAVLWSFVTLATRSIIPAVISHGFFNGFQLLALFYLHPTWN